MRDERLVFRLCDQVRAAGLALHSYLRHGHLERVYGNGLAHRLRKGGLRVDQQNPVDVVDEDGTLLGRYMVDLLVEDHLLVEVKACATLAPEHVAQVLGYLRASNQCDALLINFGAPKFQIRKFILSD